MAAEESYEDRQKRLKEAERKRRAEKRSKRFKKLWQMFGVPETIKLETQAAREAVNALNLTQKDLRHLKREFDEIDVDQSGSCFGVLFTPSTFGAVAAMAWGRSHRLSDTPRTREPFRGDAVVTRPRRSRSRHAGSMDAVEFFDMLDEERTPLTDELFALMDLDGSGTIEFDEFIAVLLTYCMYTKDDILRFCFDTFDKDKSNSIDENEFMALLSTVNNGAPLFPGNMGTALMNFDSNDDGLIDFQEFKVIETRYPMIFFPAFRLQDRMQQKTLGETRWRDLMKSVQKQRFKNEHRRTHGRDPPLTYAETVQKVVCCKRPKEYDIQVIDSKRPSITSAIEAAEKKKAIMEGGKKKRSSQAEDD